MTTILIIKIGALGDVLRTTCILPGLHKKYPDVHITWFTSPEAKNLILYNPLIQKVLNRNDLLSSEALGTQNDYDLVINLDDDSWACDFAASFPIDRLIGAYSTNGTRSYTDNSTKWFDMSLISRYGKKKADWLKKQNRRTYPSLLFDILDLSPERPTLSIPDRERSFAKNFSAHYLPNNRPVVGLSTGAGIRWRYKQLSAGKTAELINQLDDSLNANFVLFGGPKEADRNRLILQLCNNKAVNAGHKNTLLEFSALIQLCDLLITSDSLALHIASCLGVPIVAFFGPTSASEIEFFNPGVKIVPKMDCICCYKRDCDIRPTCMDNISIQEVLNAVTSLLPASF